jgi:hypothetical protein
VPISRERACTGRSPVSGPSCSRAGTILKKTWGNTDIQSDGRMVREDDTGTRTANLHNLNNYRYMLQVYRLSLSLQKAVYLIGYWHHLIHCIECH